MPDTFHLKSNNEGPRVLLIGGVHGDEYEPIAALIQIVHELEGALSRGSVTIVPVSNPSAFMSKSRYGEDGLDLARICPGNETGTPSERAAHAISEKIRSSDILIDFHTGGMAMDIYPLVGYMLHPDPAILTKQQALAEATGMPLIWGTDYRPAGRTLSIARDARIPSIYLEYGGGTSFRTHVVEEYKRAVKRVLVKLEMYKEDIDSPTWKYWLEDHRHHSGFLQGMMPSNHAGIFVPEAKVGDWINQGGVLGTILSPRTGKKHDVIANSTGIVFVLRQIPSVEVGDALGGIMPVTENKKIVVDDGKSSHY